MDVHYPAVYEPQELSGFCVRFIDLPETVTQGEDLDACAFNGAM